MRRRKVQRCLLTAGSAGVHAGPRRQKRSGAFCMPMPGCRVKRVAAHPVSADVAGSLCQQQLEAG